jgi:hypothetical protein
MSSEEEASAGSVVCAMPQGRLVSSKPPSRIANTGGSRRWDPQFGWLKVNSSPAASRLAARKKYPVCLLSPSPNTCATPPPCASRSTRGAELGHRRPARYRTCGWRAFLASHPLVLGGRRRRRCRAPLLPRPDEAPRQARPRSVASCGHAP